MWTIVYGLFVGMQVPFGHVGGFTTGCAGKSGTYAGTIGVPGGSRPELCLSIGARLEVTNGANALSAL